MLPSYHIPLYPITNFSIPIYFLIVSYAIFKHQLMNLQLVIKKGVIYSFTIATITIIYFLSIFIIERVFQDFVGYQSFIISLSTAIIVSIIFIPLKNKLQSIVDCYFFKGTPIQIAEENKLLRQEIIHSEKLKAVATLASGMAHEIKNPLTAVKTFTEFLPQRLDDKEFLLKFSKIVGSEVSRIDNLVHQLLEFSKPAPLQLKPTDINQLISDTLDFLSSQFLQSRIDAYKELCSYCPILSIDQSQFKQAFLNIILNAIEAMKAGGTLTVETKIKGLAGLGVKEIFSDSKIPNSQNPIFTIAISDTGPGIPPKNLEHIFDPFFTTKDEGTGLGLSIAHGIIQEHGGRIVVKSEIGKGTEFTIGLPLKTGSHNYDTF